MTRKKIWQIGGFVAGAVLIAFGAVSIYMGATATRPYATASSRSRSSSATAEDPAVAKYADQWAGEQVTNGDQARAFARSCGAHARVDRRPDVRADGPVPVGCKA